MSPVTTVTSTSSTKKSSVEMMEITASSAGSGTTTTTTTNRAAILMDPNQRNNEGSATDGNVATVAAVLAVPPPPLQEPKSQPPPVQQQQQLVVLRKYLCFAPRPDEWDKYSTAILQSKAVTKESIQMTLQHLYELHPQFRCYFNTENDNVVDDDNVDVDDTCGDGHDKSTSHVGKRSNNHHQNHQTMVGVGVPQLRRTGPGRKSNAEYAIQFYEYLLQQLFQHGRSTTTGNMNHKNNNNKNSQNKNNNNNDDDDDDDTTNKRNTVPLRHPSKDSIDINVLAHTKIHCEGADNMTIDTTSHDASAQSVTPAVEIATDAVTSPRCEVCCQSIPSLLIRTKGTHSTDTGITEPRQGEMTTTTGVIHCSTCPKLFHTSCVRPKYVLHTPSVEASGTADQQSKKDPDNDHSEATTVSSTQQLQQLQQQPYQCAYCILSTYKRNDKHRKQAAAAVRFMARLRKQHEQRNSQQVHQAGTTNTNDATHDEVNNDVVMETIEDSNDEDDKVVIWEQEEDDCDVEDTTGILQHKANEGYLKPELIHHNANDTREKGTNVDTGDIAAGNASEQKMDLVPNAGLVTTTTTAPSSPARSSRRCRKQPTLYNPQDGPASRWQTDELTEWKLQRAKEDEEEEAKIQALKAMEINNELTSSHTTNMKSIQRKALRHEKKDGGVLCNFCLDDPNIPICVFCACRTCFGKHCQNELLLCDNCDEEYHIFCLNPPLKCVPAPNQPWYCVNCTKRDDNDSVVRLSRRGNVNPAKPGPGTSAITSDSVNISPSSRRSLRSPKLSMAAMQMLSSMKETAYEKGIPPTTGSSNSNNLATMKIASMPKPTKRPRGRPPKADTSTGVTTTQQMMISSEHSTNETVNSSMSRVVPRFPNSNIGCTESPIKRRPGRPPTKSTEFTNIESKPKSSMQQSSKGRKRGRPPSEETLAKRAKIDAMAKKAARQQAKSIFTSSSSPSAAVLAPTNVSSNKRNNNEYAAMSISESATPKAANDSNNDTGPAPIIVSRSGRTVKRSNFHDELIETEQHLKQVRSSNEKNYNPSPSPRNTVSITSINAAAMSASNDGIPRLSEHKLSISIHSSAEIASGPPTLSSQTGGSVATEQNDSMYLFDSSSIKMPAKDFASVSNSNMDRGGYDDNESFDQDEMSATYTTMNPTIQDITSEVQTTTESAGATQAQPMQSQHQSRGSFDALKQPRRKPGARECMQISRRFGVKEIPQQYMDTLLDYCNRGKVEHLIRMRERLDEHSRFLEMQLAGLESLVLEHGESDVVVPLAPPSPDRRHE